MIDVRVIKDSDITWVLPLFVGDEIQPTKIDLTPPASGPEAEVTFDTEDEQAAVDRCTEAGLTVLASRRV